MPRFVIRDEVGMCHAGLALQESHSLHAFSQLTARHRTQKPANFATQFDASTPVPLLFFVIGAVSNSILIEIDYTGAKIVLHKRHKPWQARQSWNWRRYAIKSALAWASLTPTKIMLDSGNIPGFASHASSVSGVHWNPA